jgi:hypothetical protein
MARDRYSDWPAVIFTANSFAGIDEGLVVDDDCSVEEALESSVKAKVEWDTIWVTKPESFSKASTYGRYGNEPSTDSIYVAGALFVAFPEAGDWTRKI